MSSGEGRQEGRSETSYQSGSSQSRLPCPPLSLLRPSPSKLPPQNYPTISFSWTTLLLIHHPMASNTTTQTYRTMMSPTRKVFGTCPITSGFCSHLSVPLWLLHFTRPVIELRGIGIKSWNRVRDISSIGSPSHDNDMN